MSNYITWFGISFDKEENPETAILCYGTFREGKIAVYQEANKSPEAILDLEKMLLNYIEAVRAEKSIMKIMGEDSL